ncbi:MAG: 2'-5' RNA ligase family protein [Sneathiella sp.]|nr:2'-5' RNA ligase family protein [Sneathiella sp.]
MKALNYPPHLTFVMYPEIDMETLWNVTKFIFDGRKKLTLTFTEIRRFENSPLVLYAHPSDVTELTEFHWEIHSRINPLLCEDYYRPDNWVAHCTLGTNILPEKQEAAMALVREPFDPIEVVFDAADCLNYPPISRVERLSLADE